MTRGLLAWYLRHPIQFVMVRWDVYQMRRFVRLLKREKREQDERRRRAMS